ncbi:MAG TPA: SRPBCC domain-containing protein [Rhodanobacteraceae bacterium]
MNPYQRTLVINADPAAVYAAISTTDGLRGWWTPDCSTDTHVGGIARFHFGDTHKDMRIERLDANREVHWLCTRAFIAIDTLARKDEWVGTEIVFRLTPTVDGKTRVDFEHIGLEPALECYDRCNSGWNYFLASLQQFVETGRGTPWSVPCAA